MCEISVVIPVYNNAPSLEELYRQLKEVLLPYSFEILCVDDASSDGSLSILQKLSAQDPAVSVLPLSCNVGQHRAVLQGLKQAKGDVIITLDADLQDHPQVIPQLLSKLEEGYGAVFAGRSGHYESSFRLLTSKVFKQLLHWVAGVPKDAGMFLAMRRSVAEKILQISMPSPFIVAMIGLSGDPLYSIPIVRKERAGGGSSYTGWMRLKIGIRTVLQVLYLRVKG